MLESNPDGSAMISLLKQDSWKKRKEIKKMQEGEEASSMVLFIVGLWILL